MSSGFDPDLDPNFNPNDENQDDLAYRQHREHGGTPARPDDDEIARRLERERVDAGVESYDPEDVPPATDAPATFDPKATEEYAEEKAEARRQSAEGELYPIDKDHPYPPSHYDRS